MIVTDKLTKVFPGKAAVVDLDLRVEPGAAEISRQTGAATLEEAFSKLTGGRDAGQTSGDLLAALERV